MSTGCVNIAITGAGASGTITAIQLLRKLNVPAKIFLIEKRKEAVFRGAAYSSSLEYEPLNVQAGRMSVFNHLPDDFYNWLKENKQADSETEIDRDTFVSRRWFGDYLTVRLNEAIAQAKYATFELVQSEVKDVDVVDVANAYDVILDDNRNIRTAYLVFAMGNEPPGDIFTNGQLLLLKDKYVSNPWGRGVLDGAQTEDDILILGTGLTAVDHIVSLHKRGHKGNVYCFSRNGYFPLVHTTSQNFVFDVSDEPKEIAQILNEIRSKITAAADKGIEWQNVIDAMRARTPRIWRRMSTASKRLFIKRLKVLWEIHRHRMPEASAKIIEEIKNTGKLKVLAGNFTGIETVGGKVLFRYADKVSKVENTIETHFIINCTGPSGDYYKTGNTLIKKLLSKGWMKQDELKLGIVTGIRGEIMRDNGVVLQNAYSVGPMRKAMEWESTAMREIRTQGEAVAMQISSATESKHEIMVEIGL